ncbi:MAG: hypothetical protein Q4C47_01720, partial [Planctomycetia bacterium]|nr:hypothetical protein [Planctomycetia bacterium]
ISVQVEPGIRTEIVRNVSLLRVDSSDPPISGSVNGNVPVPIAQRDAPGDVPESGSSPWSGTWKYATTSSELVLKLEKIRPRISVNLLTEIEVRPDQRFVRTTAEYRIEDAGTFDLSLNIPEDYEIRYLRGRGYHGVQSAAVSDWKLESPVDQPDGPKTRLVIRLARRTIGKVGIVIGMSPRMDNSTGKEVNLVPHGFTAEEADEEDGTEKISGENTPTKKGSASETNVDGTGSTGEQRWRFAAPSASTPEISETNGTLVVLAPDRLQVNVRETSGAQSVSPADVYLSVVPDPQSGEVTNPTGWTGIPPTVRISDDPSDLKRLVPIAAYLTGRGAARLEVTAIPRKPQVTVRQFLKTSVDEGLVQYDAFFFYDIRYSGVAQLKLNVPESVALTLRNDTSGIHETRPDPMVTDVEPGYVTKAYRGDSELFGSGTIHLSWREKLSLPRPGQVRRVKIPKLIPVEVTSAWGQIGIVKSEAIDVLIPDGTEKADASGEPEPGPGSTSESGADTSGMSIFAGLLPIDPRYDLMEGVTSDGYARAFSFFGNDWNLSLDVTRYALESPADTSVGKAMVQMVVTRADRVSVQAVWNFRTSRQRLMLWLPPGATLESQPRLDGKPIVLEKSDLPENAGKSERTETGRKTETKTVESDPENGTNTSGNRGEWFQVPVLRSDPDRVMILHLRYTMPADTGTQLRESDQKAVLPGMAVVLPVPELGRETPVQKRMFSVWIPGEYRPIDHGGAWTFLGGGHRNFGSDRYDQWMIHEFLENLPEDVAVQRIAELSDFPVDGVHVAFESVGSVGEEPLELRYVKTTYLKIVIFLVTLLVGTFVWFVPRSARGRLVAIGVAGVVVALIVLLDTDVGIVTIGTLATFAGAMFVNFGIWGLSGCLTLWRCVCRRAVRNTEEPDHD